MDQALAFMIGTLAVIAGLSLIVRAHDWLMWMKHLRQTMPNSALWLGYFHLMSGFAAPGFSLLS